MASSPPTWRSPWPRRLLSSWARAVLRRLARPKASDSPQWSPETPGSLDTSSPRPVAAGLASSGVDVLEAGVIPTPALAFLVADRDADFGVMISASHNAAPDNGIKIFAPRRPQTSRRGRAAHRRGHGRRTSCAPRAPESVASIGSPTPRTATSCISSDRSRTAWTASTWCSTAPTARHPASRRRRSATPAPR